MYELEKKLIPQPRALVLSFDLEWTKNYRIRNANEPFCFSFVSVDLATNLLVGREETQFGVTARYATGAAETPALLASADEILGSYLRTRRRLIVVGHQLSSDISVLLRKAGTTVLPSFERLRDAWRGRRNGGGCDRVSVFDTRYDLAALLTGASRRLVDVCAECNLNVRQPELQSSMTAMQRQFLQSGDRSIQERLQVLNIRHSLSAALLYLLFRRKRVPRRELNVNRVLYRNLKQRLVYLESDTFARLL